MLYQLSYELEDEHHRKFLANPQPQEEMFVRGQISSVV
jgi:hypothetical protein